MIPSFLGNAVGGGLFTGVVYWYLFLSGGEEIEVFEGEMTAQDTAVYEQVRLPHSPSSPFSPPLPFPLLFPPPSSSLPPSSLTPILLVRRSGL